MNKLKEFGIEENTYKECLKQALRAGAPTYKFLLGEKVCMGCTAHKTICAILDNGLCYLVDDGDKFMCKPWHELRPFSEGNSSFTKLSYGKLCCSNVSVEALLILQLRIHFVGVGCVQPEFHLVCRPAQKRSRQIRTTQKANIG